MENTFLEFGRKILKSQPFTQLLGAHLEAMEHGHCEVHLDLTADHLQHHGFVHGGVTASLADICLAFAGGSVLRDAVTADLKLDYVNPGRGKKLIGVGTVIHHKGRSAYCEARIYTDTIDDNNIVMLATGTIRQPSVK